MRGQTPRLDHPQVGGHLVASLQQHDVAGHKVGPVHRYPSPIAQHGGLWCQHAPDRRHRGFGLALLDEADDGVRQHHGKDHPGIDPMLQGPRHNRSTDQHIDQHIVELPQETDQRPPRPHFRQAVWPMFGQPPRRLGRSQTIGCCGKVGKAIGDGDGVRFGQVHHRAV